MAFQKWLNIIRLAGGLIIFLLLAALSALGFLGFDPRPVLFVVIPAYLALAAIWFLANKKFASLFFINLQLVIDVAAITLGINFVGGPHSNFIFFYLVAIVSASIISVGTVIRIGASSLVLHNLAIVLEQLSQTGSVSRLQADDIVRSAILLALIVLVAFQSNYLISRLRKQEEEFDKEREEFLLRTTHDLRGPANSFKLILEKYLEGKYPKEIKEDAKLATEIANGMLQLIKDLLSIGREHQGVLEIKKESVDLKATLEKVIKKLRPGIKDKKIKLTYSPPPDLPPVSGDKEKLEEALANLAENAVKYNKPGGSIIITHAIEGKTVKTAFADTGIGIGAEFIPKLFAPYSRAVGKEIPGSGLGLYIVKKLIEKMGGSIAVSSTLGQGSVFTVSLLFAEPQK